MRLNTCLFLSGLASLCLVSGPAYAYLHLPPRVSALAYASDYTVGQADLMLPFYGNTRKNLYVDPALSYGSDNQGAADIGLGYRWIANDAAILGGYLFGGYSRIDNNARLWVVNPGIEAMGSRWDARLNAYFPMGDRHYGVGTDIVPFFTGHSQLGSVFLINQYVGSGADAKVGYQLFPGSSWKGYLGSYYFSPAETRNVWGGAAGLEYWLTQNVKLVGSYTYDNLRCSTYAFGIGVEWGGTRVHRVDPDLEERLTDPVERYLAELGRGSKIPSTLKNKPLLTAEGTITNITFANNIAFFSQTGGPNNGGTGLTLENCTFESPCGPSDFTPESVSTLGPLLPGTQFYFNGGTYTRPAGTLTLEQGQSIRSRTTDYSQPATGAARSTILGDTLFLSGNNTLENIILLPETLPATSAAVSVMGGDNTLITGSQLGSPSRPFSPGLFVDAGSSNTLINQTDIFAAETGFSSTGVATIQDSRISVSATTATPTAMINLSPGGMLFLNRVLIDGSGENVVGISVAAGSKVVATNTGLLLTSTSTIEVTAGLFSAGGGEISFADGLIDIVGPAAEIKNVGAPDIVISGTSCKLNGIVVTC